MDTILVVNAGSSSLKFDVFAVGTALTKLVKGQLESIGTTPHFAVKNAKGEQVVNRSYSSGDVPDLASAMHHVGAWLRTNMRISLSRLAIGSSMAGRTTRARCVLISTSWRSLSDMYRLRRFGILRRGVRRYGFHGLSYEYVAGRLREVAPDIARGRVIVAHLGNGASMCALRDGQSLECTFGLDGP